MEKKGATLLAGGTAPAEKGYFVEATIFTDCHDEMAIVKEEIFGPVMSVLSFNEEDEVIKRANATKYGLAAGIVTNNLTLAHRVIHKLEAGICWINTWGNQRLKCRWVDINLLASAAKMVSKRSMPIHKRNLFK